jgi:RNA polymerase sigma-70 factor, ECF subfamily
MPRQEPANEESVLARTFRESAGRAVATLARVFGDLDIAEDAVQEAVAVAIERWPADGLPPNPGGWIVTTARHKALDRLRRESTRSGREAQAVVYWSRSGTGPSTHHPGASPVTLGVGLELVGTVTMT